MTDSETERIVVTIDDKYLSSIDSVAAELQAAGMTVSNVMPSSGIIAGTVLKSRLPALSSTPGVIAVERDEEMRAI